MSALSQWILSLLLALQLLASSSSARSDQTGHWFSSGTHKIYYELHGQGTPLLLLPGGGSSIQQSFSAQLGPFSLRHQVIAVEQVGNGHSPDTKEPFSYESMTADTAALLKFLNRGRVDVVGWSDGGIIALLLAVEYPGLVNHVVVSGVNRTPSGLRPEVLRSLRSGGLEHVLSTDDAATYKALSPDGPDHLSTIESKLKTLWLTLPDPEELSAEKLRKIQSPVLVIGGDHDVVMASELVSLFEGIPNAYLWILPNTFHDVFRSRKDRVTSRTLAFIEGRDSDRVCF